MQLESRNEQLWEAVWNNDPQAVRRALALGADVNAKEGHALSLAVANECSRVIGLLLEAEPEVRSSGFRQSLACAAQSGYWEVWGWLERYRVGQAQAIQRTEAKAARPGPARER